MNVFCQRYAIKTQTHMENISSHFKEGKVGGMKIRNHKYFIR